MASSNCFHSSHPIVRRTRIVTATLKYGTATNLIYIFPLIRNPLCYRRINEFNLALKTSENPETVQNLDRQYDLKCMRPGLLKTIKPLICNYREQH
jgi:hypothetical protein